MPVLRFRSSVAIVLVLTGFVRAESPSPTFNAALAVQDALRRGRELMKSGDAVQAVQILEAQLPFINGNSAYLALLREAYGEAIKKHELDRRNDLASDLRQRVQILEGGVKQVAAIQPPAEDPFQQQPKRSGPGSTALADAEREFAAKRFRPAADLFAKAFAESPSVAKSHAAPWSYCKLFVAHERLSRDDVDAAALRDLEIDVAMALSMAAGDEKLGALGRQLQAEVRRRRGGDTIQIEVKHVERTADAWARAETANFRLHHALTREQAERVVRVAESARAAAFKKWADRAAGNWNPVCDVYLHPTAADYTKATGKADSSPGHSTYQVQNGAVRQRRLDLRGDDPNLLTNVIPHETTHIVVGELLADVALPRWADEAMAVLAEPRAQVERYARTLHRCRANGELVPLAQLMRQADYPDAKQITAFYVESVSIADHLIAERDPKTFLIFLRDASRGLDSALQKHYRCQNVAELQDRWLRKTFSASDARGSSHP